VRARVTEADRKSVPLIKFPRARYGEFRVIRRLENNQQLDERFVSNAGVLLRATKVAIFNDRE